MNYFYMFVAVFFALLLVEMVDVAFTYYVNLRNARKRREMAEKLQDYLIEQYAGVENVDSVVEEWKSE